MSLNNKIKEGIIVRDSWGTDALCFLLVLKKYEKLNLFDVMISTGQIYYGQMLGDGWVAL